MKACEWIDKIKTVKGWDSDYRVAKELHLSRNTISTYRGGRSQTMDEDTAMKVAHVLGMNPAGIIIDQVAERSKDESVLSTLTKVAGQLCILCKVSVTGFLLLAEKLAVVPRPLSHR